MSTQLLSVVTVTYNNHVDEIDRFAMAYEAARNAAGLLGLRVQLLYVDNGARSDLAARVGEPNALLVLPHQQMAESEAECNVGYGPAMHDLWQQAFDSGSIAVITANPDGAFHPDCIVRLHEMNARKPGHLYEARQFPAEHPKTYDASSGVTPWASGCCIYVSKDVFSRVGNVDPNFWLYLEDVDYSWRVRAAGRLVLVCAGALYAHDTVNRIISERARFEMYKAGRLLGWKWGGQRFQRQCERVLERQFPQHLLPELTQATLPVATTQSVTNFAQAFTFADLRWTL